MGVKLQLVLGVVLVFSVCDGSPRAPLSRHVRQASDNSTTPQNVAPDRHVNLIEKIPKTEPELKTVNTNTQKNLTSIKLSKSEPYATLPETSTSTSSEELKKNIVEQEQYVDNKENAIKQDSSEKTREDNSRSIDLDIKKFVSPDFHSKNNVFTVPISSDTEKYIDNVFEHKSSTPKLTDFSKLELTTPKTEFFDNKFKEAVQSIEQKLEHIDIEEDTPKDENLEEDNSKPVQVDKLIEEDITTPKSKLDYKEFKNVVQHNNEDKNATHKDTTVEQVKKINFVSSFTDTMVYNDDEDDDKRQKGDSEKLEATTNKNNFIITTRKSVTLTKPPISKNSYIFSNRIETETLKAINVITTEAATTKRFKGEEESLTTTEKSKGKEETIEDNQVISVQATTPMPTTTELVTTEAPTTSEAPTTTEAVTTTVPDDKWTTTVTELVQETTVGQEVTDRVEDTTTSADELTTDHRVTTEAFTTTDKVITEEPTTIIEQKTESVTEEQTTLSELTSTLPPRDWTTTTEIEATTTTTAKEEATTVMKENLKLLDTTTESASTSTEGASTEGVSTRRASTDSILTERASTEGASSDSILTERASTEPTTFQADQTETTFRNEDKTTETDIRTTQRDFRTSKGMVFVDLATTESADKTTTEAEVTTKAEATTLETTKYAELELTTIARKETTTTTALPVEVSTTTTTPTTTVAPHGNQITDEVPNETTEERNVFPTTIKTISTSTVDFIHIETVSDKHTTLLPETLRPSFNYPTPDVVRTVDNKTEAAVEDTTVVNVTEETSSDSPSTDTSVVDPPGDNKGTIAAIVISTVGAVCLVLLAGLLYIMRKRQKRFNYGQRCRPVGLDDYSMDNVSVYNSVRRKGVLRHSKRSYGNPAFDDPVAVTHPLNFPALANFANNADDIKAEFEEIPQIAAKTSELPEGCEIKNRYANVIPLPETRVFLKPIDSYPNSDYINANYVTGPKETRGYYIACQAPLLNTVDDFWRMIWEQQTKVVLMLTHLFENGVEKSVDYLPPSEVLDCHRLFGDFQVTLKRREVKDKYIISSLQLKNMVSNSWREITHFWYMGWPEKGVPSEGNSLIAFLIEARSFMKTSTLDKNAAATNGNMQNGTAHNEVNPVVVHCSPGTGRTGVVIACDIAIREFEQTRLVDIPRIVYRIRRDRASAVQTKEQYMFIYKVVSLYATKLTGGALDSL